ncbi:MAG: O-linked GlcNAc transferase [Pirellula sp.]|nr:O-linked GlcNAc transferase [Pirellula sp.]
MSSASDDRASPQWSGLRATIVGKLAGMTKRETRKQLTARGTELTNELTADVGLVIVGEQDLPPPDLAERLAALGAEAEAIRVVSETQLWQMLGLVEAAQQIHQLYTPAMLADLLGVPAAAVRGWHRRGLIRAAREVHRLPYFDFREVQTARRLAELLAGGASPESIAKQLSDLRRLLPSVERPLEQLSVIVDGGELLLRQGSGLVEAGGQFRLNFDDAEPADGEAPSSAVTEVAPLPDAADGLAPPRSAAALLELAAGCEESGRLADAADLYRAALATSGPDAVTCFLLADVLYRLGDLGAARERYFMAIELNEDYVEARANLGCLLAEEGRPDLAIASFEGALDYHDDYADVHYHLARTLDEVARGTEAERHWQAFLDLAPDSPWAAGARRRLGLDAAVVLPAAMDD